MIQALDLARENAVLKDEIDRLRRKVASLARAGETSAAGVAAPSEGEGRAHGPSDSDEASPRLVVIMPRYGTEDYGRLADRFARVRDCEVIVDRRVAERRRRRARGPVVERRQSERRAAEGETSVALVVSVGSVDQDAHPDLES